MLICPKCKCEYQEGYTICDDCKCELIKLPEVVKEDMPVEKNSKINSLIGMLLIFGAIFVIGIIILMNSVHLGDNEMSNMMMAQGGIMDTNKYIIYLEQSIISFRIIGFILSLLGGLGILTIINRKA